MFLDFFSPKKDEGVAPPNPTTPKDSVSKGSEDSGDNERDGVRETPHEKTAQILLSEQVFCMADRSECKTTKNYKKSHGWSSY